MHFSYSIPMDLQQLEYNTPLRIKFASINEIGNLVPDAHVEYTVLFPNQSSELEGGWIATQSEMIQTKNASFNHRTWTLSHDNIQIVAVEHETGIELLFDIFRDTGVSVATVGITSLIAWMWNKWRASRKLPGTNKVDPSYVRETVEYFPDGRTKKSIREEIRGPVSAEVVREHTADALAEFTKQSNE